MNRPELKEILSPNYARMRFFLCEVVEYPALLVIVVFLITWLQVFFLMICDIFLTQV